MFETMTRTGPAKSLTTAGGGRGMIVPAGDGRPPGVALKHGPVVRILVIEDNLSDVFLLERALNRQDLRYELVHLLTGGDALAFFRRQGAYADAAVPNLILVDLNLSKYTGEDILCEIQRSPHLGGSSGVRVEFLPVAARRRDTQEFWSGAIHHQAHRSEPIHGDRKDH